MLLHYRTSKTPSRMATFERVAKLLIIGLLIINTVITLISFSSYQSRRASKPSEKEYSYLGDDFPSNLPLIPSEVAMQVESSIHYPINDIMTSMPSSNSSTAPSLSDWESLYPSGHGFVRLGPNYRALALSVYHQLHCLDMLRMSVGSHKWTTHTIHCLAYLRMGALCAVDLHLEPVEGGGADGGEGGMRLGKAEGLHRCRDWTQVYEEEERLHQKYRRWHKSHNTSTMSISS